jgi:hypothetical protein
MSRCVFEALSLSLFLECHVVVQSERTKKICRRHQKKTDPCLRRLLNICFSTEGSFVGRLRRILGTSQVDEDFRVQTRGNSIRREYSELAEN